MKTQKIILRKHPKNLKPDSKKACQCIYKMSQERKAMQEARP